MRSACTYAQNGSKTRGSKNETSNVAVLLKHRMSVASSITAVLIRKITQKGRNSRLFNVASDRVKKAQKQCGGCAYSCRVSGPNMSPLRVNVLADELIVSAFTIGSTRAHTVSVSGLVTSSKRPNYQTKKGKGHGEKTVGPGRWVEMPELMQCVLDYVIAYVIAYVPAYVIAYVIAYAIAHVIAYVIAYAIAYVIAFLCAKCIHTRQQSR